MKFRKITDSGLFAFVKGLSVIAVSVLLCVLIVDSFTTNEMIGDMKMLLWLVIAAIVPATDLFREEILKPIESHQRKRVLEKQPDLAQYV